MGKRLRAVAKKGRYKLYVERLPNSGDYLIFVDDTKSGKVVRSKRIREHQVRRMIIIVAKEWFKKVVRR